MTDAALLLMQWMFYKDSWAVLPEEQKQRGMQLRNARLQTEGSTAAQARWWHLSTERHSDKARTALHCAYLERMKREAQAQAQAQA